MAWWAPLIGAGAAIGAQAFSKKPKAPNYRRITDEYLNRRPKGWLTPEDKAMAARTRSRGNEAAAESARYGMGRVNTTLQRRGLAGSAAGAAMKRDVQAGEALGRQRSFEKSADQEYGMYDRNRAYEEGILSAGFGAELGGERQRYAQEAAQNSSFWNSVLEMTPWLVDAYNPAQTNPGEMAAMAPGGYNPKQTRTYDQWQAARSGKG